MTPSRRIRTGPLARVSAEAFVGPRTFEARLLPGVFLVAFVALIGIQLWLAS